MKDIVSRYIEEELLVLSVVELPWVGQLYIERQSAAIDYETGLITPPYDSLELSGGECPADDFLEGLSIFLQNNTTVGHYLSLEQFYERAEAEYEAWWQNNRTDNGELLIDGVCTINTELRRVTSVEEALLDMLLPYSEPIALPMATATTIPMEVTQPVLVEQEPQRGLRYPRVAHISTFGLVLAIVLFTASILYIGYLVLNATIL